MISFLTELKSLLPNDCVFTEKVSKLIVYQIVKKYFDNLDEPPCQDDSDLIERLLDKIRTIEEECVCVSRESSEYDLPTVNYPENDDFVLTVHKNKNRGKKLRKKPLESPTMEAQLHGEPEDSIAEIPNLNLHTHKPEYSKTITDSSIGSSEEEPETAVTAEPIEGEENKSKENPLPVHEVFKPEDHEYVSKHTESDEELESATPKRIDYEFFYKQPTISSFKSSILPTPNTPHLPTDSEALRPMKRYNDDSTEENISEVKSFGALKTPEASPEPADYYPNFAKDQSLESLESQEDSSHKLPQHLQTANLFPASKNYMKGTRKYDRYSSEFIRDYLASEEVKEMNSVEFSNVLHQLKEPGVEKTPTISPMLPFRRRFSLFRKKDSSKSPPGEEPSTTTTTFSPSTIASYIRNVETTSIQSENPSNLGKKYAEYVDEDLFEDLIKSTEEISPASVTTINPSSTSAYLQSEHPNLPDLKPTELPTISATILTPSTTTVFIKPNGAFLPHLFTTLNAEIEPTTVQTIKKDTQFEPSLEYTENIPTTTTITTSPSANGFPHKIHNPLGEKPVLFDTQTEFPNGVPMTTSAPTTAAIYLGPKKGHHILNLSAMQGPTEIAHLEGETPSHQNPEFVQKSAIEETDEGVPTSTTISPVDGLIKPTGIYRKNLPDSDSSSDESLSAQTRVPSSFNKLKFSKESTYGGQKINKGPVEVSKELPSYGMNVKEISLPKTQQSGEAELSSSNNGREAASMFYKQSTMVMKEDTVESEEISEISLELSGEIPVPKVNKQPSINEGSMVQPDVGSTIETSEYEETNEDLGNPNKLLTTTNTEHVKRKGVTVPVPKSPKYNLITRTFAETKAPVETTTPIDSDSSPEYFDDEFSKDSSLEKDGDKSMLPTEAPNPNRGSRRNNDQDSDSVESSASAENTDSIENMIMELPKPNDNKDYPKYIRVKHMLTNKAPILKVKGIKRDKKRNLQLTLNAFLQEGVDSDTNDAIRYYLDVLDKLPESQLIAKRDHTNFQKILPKPENEKEETYFSNLTSYLQQIDPIIKQVDFPADQDKQERLAQLLLFLRQTNKAKKYKNAIDYYLQNKFGKKKLQDFSYLSLMDFLPKPEDEKAEHHYDIMKNFLQDDNVMLLLEFIDPDSFENKLELFKVLSTEVLNSNLSDEIKDTFTYYFGEPKLIRIQLLTHKEIRKKFDITEILIDTLIVDDLAKQQAFTTFFDFISQSNGDLLQNFEGWINVKTEGEFITALLRYLLEQEAVPDQVKSAINKLIPLVRMDGDGAKPI